MQNVSLLLGAALGVLAACAAVLAPVRLTVRARLAGRRGRSVVEARWLALPVRCTLRFGLPAEPGRHVLRWALAFRGGRPVLDRSRLARARGLTGHLVRLARAAAPALGHLRRRVRVERFDVHVRIGAGDAMRTAVAYGAAWAVTGQVLAATASAVRLPAGRVRVSLVPDFDRDGLWGTVCVRTRLRALDFLIGAWLTLRAGGLAGAREALRGVAAARRLADPLGMRLAVRIGFRPRRAG